MEIIEDLHTVRPCVLSHLIDVWAIVGGWHDGLYLTPPISGGWRPIRVPWHIDQVPVSKRHSDHIESHGRHLCKFRLDDVVLEPRLHHVFGMFLVAHEVTEGVLICDLGYAVLYEKLIIRKEVLWDEDVSEVDPIHERQACLSRGHGLTKLDESHFLLIILAFGAISRI